MNLLLTMPGGSEWILILIFFGFLLIAPVLAIYYYLKSRRLTKELEKYQQK